MSARKTGSRAAGKKTSGKKAAGKKIAARAVGKKTAGQKTAGKKAAGKKGAAKKSGAARERKLSREELARRFPESCLGRRRTFDVIEVKFEAATTGRVVKSPPVSSRLGDDRIEAAVRAVVERRAGRG